MPTATLYNLSFTLQIIAEAESVENHSEISESMVRGWRKDQANLFNGELLNCQQNIRRWVALHQSITNMIKGCWSGLQTREVKLR